MIHFLHRFQYTNNEINCQKFCLENEGQGKKKEKNVTFVIRLEIFESIIFQSFSYLATNTNAKKVTDTHPHSEKEGCRL